MEFILWTIISMVLFRPQSSVLIRHKLFSTKHHVSLNISTTTIDVTAAVSIHDCALQCVLNSVCCVASFYSNSCILESSCFPQTVNTPDANVLIKNESKGLYCLVIRFWQTCICVFVYLLIYVYRFLPVDFRLLWIVSLSFI